VPLAWPYKGMSWMVEQAPSAAKHRSRTRLVVQGVLSLVLVVVIFYFLRRRIDPTQVWAAIAAMTWLELATLGLLAVWNLCTYAFVWMSVTPGLGFWRAMVMTQATTTVANTVPGGSAIGIGMTYSMLRSWGYSRSRTTTAVLVSGCGTASSSWACQSWPWPSTANDPHADVAPSPLKSVAAACS
jgi:hypothetical protein